MYALLVSEIACIILSSLLNGRFTGPKKCLRYRTYSALLSLLISGLTYMSGKCKLGALSVTVIPIGTAKLFGFPNTSIDVSGTFCRWVLPLESHSRRKHQSQDPWFVPFYTFQPDGEVPFPSMQRWWYSW